MLYEVTVQLRVLSILGQSLRSKHVYLKVAKVERPCSHSEIESFISYQKTKQNKKPKANRQVNSGSRWLCLLF